MTIGVLLPLPFLIVACTDSSSGGRVGEAGSPSTPAATSTPTPGEGDTATRIWRADVDALGQPRISGSTAVVLVRAPHSQIEIVGIDVRDGSELWSHRYSPGHAPPGYAMDPFIAVADDGTESVVFQRPEGEVTSKSSWFIPLVAVDPATGATLVETFPIATYEPVGDCTDDTDACVLASDEETRRTARLDLDSLELFEDDSGIPADARSLGDGGLYSTADRPDERIGRVLDGRKLWEVPARELFGDGYGSDSGWSFEYDAENERYIGNIGKLLPEGRREAYLRGGTLRHDLAEDQLVAIDAVKGERLWTKRGVVNSCQPKSPDEQDVSPAVWCRQSGIGSFRRGDDLPTYQNLRVTLEGYDPATGKRTWSAPLTDRGGLAMLDGDPHFLSRTGDSVALTADGPMRFSATGEATPLDAKSRLMCEGPAIHLRYALAWDRGYHRRMGGSFVFACDAYGKRLAGSLTPDLLADGAIAADDGTYVIATKEGLLGSSGRSAGLTAGLGADETLHDELIEADLLHSGFCGQRSVQFDRKAQVELARVGSVGQRLRDWFTLGFQVTDNVGDQVLQARQCRDRVG